MSLISLRRFGDRMIEIFPQLMREISRYENNYLTRGEITLPQICALDFLSRHHNADMKDLATHMKLSGPSATGLMDRLTKSGLAHRERSTDDRRVVLIAISTRGKRIVKEVYAQKRKGIVKLFSFFTAQERDDYMRSIEKLIKGLAAHKNVK
jgi:MarR family transcriptional regulator, organic hydroperoxide resistance regulator